MFLDQERTWKYEDEDEDKDHEDDKDEDRCAQCISWQSRSTGQRRRERIRREGKGDPGWRERKGQEWSQKGRKIGAEIVSPFLSDLTFSPSLGQQYVMRKIAVEKGRQIVCLLCLFLVLSCICLFDNVFAAALVFQ